MNTPSVCARLQFHAFLLVPFVLAAAITAILFGCQPKAPPQKTTETAVTFENLRTAYIKEVNYSVMYKMFAERADKDRLKNIAALYRAVEKSEEIHAKDHADLLKADGLEIPVVTIDTPKVGSTIQTMKMALSCEDIEVDQMYPNLGHTAEAEKFKEAADQFAHVRDADARQRELLQAASGDLAHYPKAAYFVCPDCGYIVNSAKTDECPVCGAKKASFAKM